MAFIFTVAIPVHPDTSYRAQACEGATVKLACPSGYEVSILWAYWGRERSNLCTEGGFGLNEVCSADTTATVGVLQDLCRGRMECEVDANFGVFGNPCTAAVYKYLVVEYSCEREYRRPSD